MKSIADLMIELDGADAETVNRIAWRDGSLPVRLAMLGLASTRKQERSIWWGYPPGVFIGYKWAGPAMRELTEALAAHVRGLGYRAFLDVENLDEDADAYLCRSSSRKTARRISLRAIECWISPPYRVTSVASMTSWCPTRSR